MSIELLGKFASYVSSQTINFIEVAADSGDAMWTDVQYLTQWL